jgi:predicted alpha-1,6-mannanase (GH76 family)
MTGADEMKADECRRRADEAQQALDAMFWNDAIRMYNIATPCPDGKCNTIFHYWWMAHAVENLTDAFERTGDPLYEQRLRQIYDGLLERNGGTWINELYDDMEWMAIAWLRAYQATGDERYKAAVLELWADIRGGWNGHCGGGIAWRKSQPDYKNTPANAPAAILAARLYRAFGRKSDLEWALRIHEWQLRHLVDPESGFVWDGMNRLGDGAIDKDWKFTYCQGVFIGAALELYRMTGDEAYRDQALRTAAAAKAVLASPEGVLPPEGGGDGGLFKGIFVRYLALLAAEAAATGEAAPWIGLLETNAESLWRRGRLDGDRPLFGERWDAPAGYPVELSTQLSGVMLLEAMTRIA